MTALPAFVFAVLGEAFAKGEGVDGIGRVVLSDLRSSPLRRARSQAHRPHDWRSIIGASGRIIVGSRYRPCSISTDEDSSDDPKWADRDRFVLSKGHAAPAFYAALAEAGYFPVDDLVTSGR